jgi:FlaG/FlaF family flagellin (archaellin)
VKSAKSSVRKNRRSRKGISTIMANLTMLVIVVSLSGLLFVWATSSFGAYTGGAGYWFTSRSIANQERVSVEAVYFGSTGPVNNLVTLYVRNVGTIPFTVASLYENSTLYQISQSPVPVNQVQSIQIVLSGQTWTHGDLQTIAIATVRGTVVTTTWAS